MWVVLWFTKFARIYFVFLHVLAYNIGLEVILMTERNNSNVPFRKDSKTGKALVESVLANLKTNEGEKPVDGQVSSDTDQPVRTGGESKEYTIDGAGGVHTDAQEAVVANQGVNEVKGNR